MRRRRRQDHQRDRVLAHIHTHVFALPPLPCCPAPPPLQVRIGGGVYPEIKEPDYLVSRHDCQCGLAWLIASEIKRPLPPPNAVCTCQHETSGAYYTVTNSTMPQCSRDR